MSLGFNFPDFEDMVTQHTHFDKASGSRYVDKWALYNELFDNGASFLDQRGLDSSMGNVTASVLGNAWKRVGELEFGDSIDRGLQLVRILRETGFVVMRAK